ncbi:MAG: hypothetical protein WA821_19705 [Anaerolineales bacterium]
METPVVIETPLPKNEAGEVVLLLNKRGRPASDVVIIRLSQGCLMGATPCEPDGNILAVLPQPLLQVQSIYWTNDGAKAFFWDSGTGDIYILDGNQGKFQVFKKEVWKSKDNFVISPDGSQIMLEIQKGDHETDLVSMNVQSGDMTKFDIPDVCEKYPSQWIDNHTVLFWCEYDEGKGYLTGVTVNTLNTLTRQVQPFDLGRDWMQTSVPVFSPDRTLMAFNDDTTLVIRSVATAAEHVLSIPTESFLWSTDSKWLAIFSRSKEISIARSDGSELQKIISLSENDSLQDWMWLPDNQHILLIAGDENGNERDGVVSIVDKTFIPLNLALLKDYDAVSISFRP